MRARRRARGLRLAAGVRRASLQSPGFDCASSGTRGTLGCARPERERGREPSRGSEPRGPYGIERRVGTRGRSDWAKGRRAREPA